MTSLWGDLGPGGQGLERRPEADSRDGRAKPARRCMTAYALLVPQAPLYLLCLVLCALAGSACAGKQSPDYVKMGTILTGAGLASSQERRQAETGFDGVGRGDRSAVPALISLLTTPEWEVKARWWLAQVGPEAVPALLSVLNGLDSVARVQVVLAIGQIAEGAPECRRELERLLAHGDYRVVMTARTCLSKLGVGGQVSDEVYREALWDPSRTVTWFSLKEMLLNERSDLLQEGLLRALKSGTAGDVRFLLQFNLDSVRRSQQVSAAMVERLCRAEVDRDTEFTQVWREYESVFGRRGK
jgi:hypothetical protein